MAARGAVRGARTRLPSRVAAARGRQRTVKARAEMYLDCLRLDQYDKINFVADNGWIAPDRDTSAKGFVFAVFDGDDALQFIGFSKDIRSSLRNVFFRQPEKCQFYRFVDLPELDQKQMAGIRDLWLFGEDGRVPPGLGDDKDAWLKAPAGDIAAWEDRLERMRAQGLREEMEVDQDKLAQGVLEILPSKHEFTPQELEAQERQRAYDEAHTFDVDETWAGKRQQFELYVELDYETNGGRMFDVEITKGETTSSHRITVSHKFLEMVNCDRFEMLKRTFVYLFANGVRQQDDRNMPADIAEFPINYFSMNQVNQMFPGFGEMFPGGRVPRNDELWGFKRTRVTGPVLNEDKPLKGMPLLGPQHGVLEHVPGKTPGIDMDIGVEVEIQRDAASPLLEPSNRGSPLGKETSST